MHVGVWLTSSATALAAVGEDYDLRGLLSRLGVCVCVCATAGGASAGGVEEDETDRRSAYDKRRRNKNHVHQGIAAGVEA